MPREYANTVVSVSKTQEKIRKLLRENNVIAIRFTDVVEKILLEFNYPIKDNPNACFGVRIEINLPELDNAKKEEQSRRQYYRALYWILKAKFEAINFGLVEFGKEFLGNLLYRLPNGISKTTSELLAENQSAVKILGQSQILMIEA